MFAKKSPQMNGKAERMNRTIYNKTRCILDESGPLRYLWGHAVLTSTYLINRSPGSALNYKILRIQYGKNIDLDRLRVFDC